MIWVRAECLDNPWEPSCTVIYHTTYNACRPRASSCAFPHYRPEQTVYCCCQKFVVLDIKSPAIETDLDHSASHCMADSRQRRCYLEFARTAAAFATLTKRDKCKVLKRHNGACLSQSYAAFAWARCSQASLKALAGL